MAAYLSLLEKQGPNLKRPYADIVRGKIRELRIHYSSNQFRILYFFQMLDQKGLSQQELAKLMGTSQQAISRIESGEYEGFTLKTLEKIAEATGMRVKIEFVAA